MKLVLLTLAIALSLSACGQPRGVTTSAGDCERVDGTGVGHEHRVEDLCVGMYVGQLEKTEDGACRGGSGTGSEGEIETGIRIDRECRVYVDKVEP
jgi:hypothetical protein